MSSGRRAVRRRFVVVGSSLLFFAVSGPASAIKIVAYNLLNYPGTSAAQRDPLFRTIIADLQPDVVIAGEIDDSSAATAFRTNVLLQVNPAGWQKDTYFDCGDSDQTLFYRTAAVSTAGTDFDRATTLATTPRLTPRWKLRPNGYTNPAHAFYVYGCHLKAQDTQPDRDERAAAAALIRADANGFATGTRFMVTGDMNFYNMSTEAAYTNFTASTVDNDGRLVDVLNPTLVVQNWSENFAYRAMHTQSPRTSNPSYSGDGATGGMDDRFDFIFISTDMAGTSGLSYISGTYRSVGQDGAVNNSRYNASVNNPLPNLDVSDAVANALWGAADHLPVMLQLQAPARGTAAPQPLAFGTVIVGATATQNLTVNNTAPTPGELMTYSYASSPPGTFSGPGGTLSRAAGASAPDTIAMDTGSVGVKSLSPGLTITTNAIETPTIQVNATGTVVMHAVPSTDGGSQILGGAVDFGTHAVGGFADQNAAVHNFGYNALQAVLTVTGAQFTGPDAARFSLVNPPPVDVSGTPAGFQVHFDDTGALPGSYSATLTLTTADQSGVIGGTSLPSVTYSLAAAVSPLMKGDFNFNSVVDCPDVGPMVAVLLDPNAATAQQRYIGDMDDDTKNTGADIQLFENVLVCP